MHAPRKPSLAVAGLALAVGLCMVAGFGMRGTAASAAGDADDSSTTTPRITWEGTVTIRDRYTHDYSNDDPDQLCTGTAVTTVTTR